MDKDSRNYWAALITQIRTTLNWSQAQFADEVESDQATVSRWEQTLVLPSYKKQRQIELIAERINLSSLQGIADLVNSSPFSMILTDRVHKVLAASPSSGFTVGMGTLEQTPVEEREHFLGFAQSVTDSGFWNRSGGRFDYAFKDGDVTYRAVVTSVLVRGTVYAVVQQHREPLPVQSTGLPCAHKLASSGEASRRSGEKYE